jgi:hypothetical protein
MAMIELKEWNCPMCGIFLARTLIELTNADKKLIIRCWLRHMFASNRDCPKPFSRNRPSLNHGNLTVRLIEKENKTK